MAKFVFTLARVEINAVDLSDHVSSVTADLSKDEVDVTAMGAAYREILSGLGDGTVTVSFFQDFAAAKVHATINPLFQAGTSFSVKVRPTNAAISTTNPELQMTAVCLSYPFIGGGVGDAATLDVTFRNVSPAGPVIATT